MNGLNINPNHVPQYKWGYSMAILRSKFIPRYLTLSSMIYLYKSRYCLRVLLRVVLKGLGAFRSDKIRKFLEHIVFNESLNGPRIALNIMNEAKNFLMAKINVCFIQFKIHSKNIQKIQL